MAGIEIAFKVRDEKKSVAVAGFLKIYPNVEMTEDETPVKKYNDRRWLREKTRRNFVRDIRRGLQMISDKTPETVSEFRDQLEELSNLVRRLIPATPTEEAKEIEEISELLGKGKNELASDQPSAGRISRWLKNVNDIASNVKSNLTTFTAIAGAAKNLAEIIGSLIG